MPDPVDTHIIFIVRIFFGTLVYVSSDSQKDLKVNLTD